MATVVILGSIAAIVALTNLVKGLGLPNRYAPLVSAILGVVTGLLDYGFLTDNSSATGYYSAAAGGLLMGLAASGLYDLASRSRQPSPEVTPRS